MAHWSCLSVSQPASQLAALRAQQPSCPSPPTHGPAFGGCGGGLEHPPCARLSTREGSSAPASQLPCESLGRQRRGRCVCGRSTRAVHCAAHPQEHVEWNGTWWHPDLRSTVHAKGMCPTSLSHTCVRFLLCAVDVPGGGACVSMSVCGSCEYMPFMPLVCPSAHGGRSTSGS